MTVTERPAASGTMQVAALPHALDTYVTGVELRTLSAAAFAAIHAAWLDHLVIGVHWPADVLAAACIGAFLPLAMSFALALRRA